MLYQTAVTGSLALNETNDCTVKALSIVADTDYKLAHRALQVNGRRNRCGAGKTTILNGLKHLGLQCEKTWVKGQGYTMSSIGSRFTTGTYMVFTCNHVAAMIDGKVEDWTSGRKHRIVEVWRIDLKNAKPVIKPTVQPVIKPTVQPRKDGIPILTDYVEGAKMRPGSTISKVYAVMALGMTKKQIVEFCIKGYGLTEKQVLTCLSNNQHKTKLLTFK